MQYCLLFNLTFFAFGRTFQVDHRGTIRGNTTKRETKFTQNLTDSHSGFLMVLQETREVAVCGNRISPKSPLHFPSIFFHVSNSKYRDRHDPVSPVTPFCANLAVQTHNITSASFRVVTAGHGPYFNPTKLSFPKVEGQHARRAAGLSSFFNPVLSIYTLVPLRMPTTSDVDEFHSCDENSGENSGGEGSASSSLAFDLHGRLKRPRTRPTQIRGVPCGFWM